MSDVADLHAPHAQTDDPNEPKNEVALTANRTGNLITISGNGDFSIPVGQAATHCKFTLTDNSNANVQFSSLDAQDNSTACPTPGSGNSSGQIVGVTLKNNESPKKAQFTDNNSNQGQMSVSYAWNFTCDAPCVVTPFDPVITNGGKTQA